MDGVNCQVHWLPSLQNQSSQHLSIEMMSRDTLTSCSPHMKMLVFLGLPCAFPAFSEEALSLHLLITSLKPHGWPIAMNCVLSSERVAQTGSSHQCGIKRRIYWMCVKANETLEICANPHVPGSAQKTTRNPSLSASHTALKPQLLIQRENSIMLSHPPIQTRPEERW